MGQREGEMKSPRKSVAIWSVIASILFLTSALPSAYGLEFPMTTRIEIEPDAASLTASALPVETVAALYGSINLASTPLGSIFST